MGTVVELQKLLPEGIQLKKIRAEEDGGVTIFISSDKESVGNIKVAKERLLYKEPFATVRSCLREE